MIFKLYSEKIIKIYNFFTDRENDRKQQHKRPGYWVNGRGSDCSRRQLEHALSQRAPEGERRQTLYEVGSDLESTVTVVYKTECNCTHQISDDNQYFYSLYSLHPATIEKFPLFKGKTLEEISKHPKLPAHAMSVMYALASYIDNLHDTDLLVELVKKTAVSHIGRGVGSEYFKVVSCNFCINCHPVNSTLLGIFYFINSNA